MKISMERVNGLCCLNSLWTGFISSRWAGIILQDISCFHVQ